MINDFNTASNLGSGTPQEIADYRENHVQAFLKRYFPATSIVSKGKITDLEGNQSDSIDCLILSPSHPNLIDSRGKFQIIFSDACDFAIEVKDLNSSKEIKRGLKQCISVKKLLRSKSSILRKDKIPDYIVNHSKYIPFYLFCTKSIEIKNLAKTIVNYYLENETPIEHQIDGIIILDKGILLNIKHDELNFYPKDSTVGRVKGWFFEKWADSTLIGFLLRIEYSYKSSVSISESIIKRVLTKFGKTDVEYIGTHNKIINFKSN